MTGPISFKRCIDTGIQHSTVREWQILKLVNKVTTQIHFPGTAAIYKEQSASGRQRGSHMLLSVRQDFPKS